MKSNALLDQVMHLAICFPYCKRMMARDCKCQFYRVLSVPNSVMLMAKKRIIENLGTGPSPLDFNCLRVSLIVTRFQAGQQGGEEVGLNLERQKSSACKSSLTKHLGMNTQLFRCMYGNSFFIYKLSSAQLCLKSSTEIISFAWVSWLLSFVLESFTSITACAAFKGWKMHQLSKWLRKAHQKNRLLDWGTSKGNRSQEILCIAFRCWNWKLCSSTSGHWDHCRIARDLMLTTSFFLWAGIIGITTTAIGVFAKAPSLTLWRSGDLNWLRLRSGEAVQAHGRLCCQGCARLFAGRKKTSIIRYFPGCYLIVQLLPLWFLAGSFHHRWINRRCKFLRSSMKAVFWYSQAMASSMKNESKIKNTKGDFWITNLKSCLNCLAS